MPDEQSGELGDNAQNVSATEGFASPDSTAAPESPAAIPPGWYPDPSGGAQQRWWNGATWTEHVAPHGAQHATSVTGPAPSKKRLPTLAIVGIVVGGIVVGGGLLTGVVLATTELADSIEADVRAGGADSPAATSTAEASEAPVTNVPSEPIMAVPDGWARTSILNGSGTIAYNPEWEDVSDYLGADLIEQEALDSGFELSVDGAWGLRGDIETGMSMVAVHTMPDVGGPSSARIEAQAFVKGATIGVEDVEIFSEGPVTTSHGHEAYQIELGFPYYGEQLTYTVAVIVSGHSQVIVYASGSETLGSGIDELELMLDSVWIN
ncbi:hypothetical protein Lsed01_00727 [Demequina sediminis]|uniref:DUF2510 domain-containing protein n=1 Tax=Demequina sediminis TaxID=1930058 RepID=A0ABP9WEP0_9MICO|nr:DUF2510 domain-containing protein [Demequina sediminis]BDZ62628.1 hypothetical protein GCM10025873_24190 [Demequina sediminis]